jgi:hypothetical protein
MSEKKKYIPPSKKEVLAELKQIDKFDLLKVKAKAEQPSGDSILISKFEDINNFIDENNRQPSQSPTNPVEFTLFSILFNIQLNPKHIKVLKPFDRHNLLEEAYKQLEEPEHEVKVEITEFPKEPENKLGLADKFGLLRNAGSSIFDLKHVKSKNEKITTMPEVVAKRKRCSDFEKFEPLFKRVQDEMKNGDRKAVPFQGEQDIKQGDFFIYKGISCYVEKVGEVEIKNGRKNARLRLIFENGQESNMYLRALSAELYKDGRRILSPRLSDGEKEIDEKELTGFIYVLKSKSSSPEIKAVPNLYKIGFSTTTVEERIKNAKNDPTYLMAEVKIVTSYRVAGIKPTYFENLIHKLFDHVKLKVEVTDKNGKKAVPKEWYSVPFEVIDEALKMIQTGEIIGYVYDVPSKSLIKSNSTKRT